MAERDSANVIGCGHPRLLSAVPSAVLPMHRSGSEQLGLGKLPCKIYGAAVWVETVEVEVRSTARLSGIDIRVIHEVSFFRSLPPMVARVKWVMSHFEGTRCFR